eukprot:Seg6031.2 transcript_id=Seg6031.2/GoldUCD/mRNA.D3Y31 product="SCAN domain-containing protein 3" pseudo=true protein_id=Seg6031.2/GoldUCD/D3Y31
MTTKWKGHYDTGRKYSKSWEVKFTWVSKASDGTENAFCKLCRASIQPRASNLANHEKSEKHVRRVKDTSATRKLQVVHVSKEEDDVKRIEIELATIISCHSAILTIDHLGEVIARNGKGSKLEKIKLHRSKCSKLVTKVIAPSMRDDLQDDVKGKKFSVLVDESTDVSTKKLLCAVIRYYSEKEKKIETAFVDLIQVVEARGEDLFVAMKNCIEGIGLKLEDCVGYGSDGASVMVGEHNSVWSRIVAVAPNCLQVKCICHSLALCVQHSFDKLPSSLGFLLAEIPKWFSKSTLRREAFKRLFSVMNPSGEQKGIASPFERYSKTRWLVRGKVIFNCLMNWEELKAYYMSALPTCTQDARYKARSILEMLNEPIIHLYFHFVSPLVTEFERVNAFFQATDADPEEMHQELTAHSKSLRGRVFDDFGHPVPLQAVDFGGKFEEEVKKYFAAHQDKTLAQANIIEMKSRCLSFLIEATEQVEKRLLASKDLFKGLSGLHPKRVLKANGRLAFGQLPLAHLSAAKSD